MIEDEKMYSFGESSSGHLGIGKSSKSTSFNELTFFKDKKIENIIIGRNCFILSNRKIYSFGYNRSGELGIGNTDDQHSPVELEFFREMEIQKISTCSGSTFVLTSNHSFIHFRTRKVICIWK